MRRPKVNKVYVFDTSCFIDNPYVLSNYEHKDCYIPIPVLEELDNLKNNRFDHVGMSARTAIHYLDTNNDINFCKELELKEEKQDNNIISSMEALRNLLEGRILSLVTRDLNLKVKARAFGFEAEQPSSVDIDRRNKRYTGVRTLIVDDWVIDEFYKNEAVMPKEAFSEEDMLSLSPNEYLILRSNISEKKTALARFRGNDNVQDILNTQLSVLNRLIQRLRMGDLHTDMYQLNGTASLDPFYDRFENQLAGWTATMDLQIYNDIYIC
jgi:PhoH-like ATPase